MYWNVVKRKVKSGESIKIVKTYECFGRNDFDMWYKAKRYSKLLNLFRKINNKYYYAVDFDFE